MIQVIDFQKIMLDEESCWQAVQNRDTTFDGSFIYAVHSTGVYCRPGCPSRRPRRDQVAFFNSGVEARSAGFRPCRRCHPDGALPSIEQAELILRACALIDTVVEAPPSLDALAHEFHLSPSHFHRLFKSATG